ncbi:MAG TPA: glycogen debranching N-terminal domain-containing protein [Actinomycetota bacterium]
MPEGGESPEISWVQILRGSTFMLSDPHGDVAGGSLGGLFHEDTRFLSRFTLTVNGARPSLLSSGAGDYDSAAFFLTNTDQDGIPGRSMSIQRFRFVGDGLTEVISVTGHVTVPLALELRLSCAADFADLFEVKREDFRKLGTFRSDHDAMSGVLVFEYRHDTFTAACRVHSSEPAVIEGDDLVFHVRLEPRQTWKTRIQVAVRMGTREFAPLDEMERAASMALIQWREGSPDLRRWRSEVPTVQTGWDLFDLAYRTSIADLAALRLQAEVEGNDYSLPAAGLPWFMAIFGRDTIVTSYQSLLIGPDLAKGALRALAALQGAEVNDFKDEEPGKILHEIRFGELTVLGEMPHRPYYGTSDATPLWLILLHEYWRVTGDAETVAALRGNAMRALEWIDRYGDRDGDGYVEYATRSARGLLNQGWKDSSNSVAFSNGEPAAPPIACCEIQGYAYDARVRTAELAERVWGEPDLATRLRAEAAALFDRFNADYWIDARGGYYAEALAGEPGSKRVVDSMTSNMGHLLWSGIVPPDRAALVVRQLFGDAMFSGWGVRTMSAADAAYNPVMYHNGTVWPHDNSLISAGLARYGYRREANRIAQSMVEAAGYSAYRLPEVFAGYPRAESGFPVRYPTASSPQAWATAAPFLWLRLILGAEPADGTLHVDPLVPGPFGRVVVRGLHAFGRRWDVTAEGTAGSVRLEATDPPG